MSSRAIAQPFISQAGLPGPAGDTGPAGPPGPASIWQSYTPTLTQDVTVAKTVDWARYTQFGNTVIGSIGLTITGTGTATEPVLVGLPVAASANNFSMGTAMYALVGEGTDYYPHLATLNSPTTISFYTTNSTSNAWFLGQFDTLGANQKLYIQFMYEAASA